MEQGTFGAVLVAVAAAAGLIILVLGALMMQRTTNRAKPRSDDEADADEATGPKFGAEERPLRESPEPPPSDESDTGRNRRT